MKKNLMNSRFGKLVCRIMGEEKGIVAMEYCIMGLMIGCVLIMASAIFGASLSSVFQTLSVATTGDDSATHATLAASVTTINSDASAVQTSFNKYNAGNSNINMATVTGTIANR